MKNLLFVLIALSLIGCEKEALVTKNVIEELKNGNEDALIGRWFYDAVATADIYDDPSGDCFISCVAVDFYMESFESVTYRIRTPHEIYTVKGKIHERLNSYAECHESYAYDVEILESEKSKDGFHEIWRRVERSKCLIGGLGHEVRFDCREDRMRGACDYSDWSLNDPDK